ncbi:MAG TPA: PEP-CTERM sorting domain-containing protein [Phycisphaerae bacterium]|nr:PEP-CTERM sorting domain-containing protein [Phycisphaerae bacterium]
MFVRYLIPCALVAALAPTANAYWMGNLLVPRDQATDTQPYVYTVYHNAPMPTGGYVDAISIFCMGGDEGFPNSFTMRLLHPTGIPGVYEQYYTSPVFGTYGPPNSVLTYSLGQPVQVQPGDVFVTYGGGIAFSDDSTTTDAFYFTGNDFAPSGTGIVELGTQPYTGNRTYSAMVNFTPAFSSAPVPEPASASLMCAGGIALLLIRRKGPRQSST